MFAKGAMAFIQNAGRSDRDVKPVARRSGFIQSVRKMEQACFKEMNRLMRTRMLGGVGGVRRKPAPIPIVLLSKATGGLVVQSPTDLPTAGESQITLSWKIA